MAQVNIRMDDNLKEQADHLFDELGLNMSTAVNIFIRQVVRQGGIPFDVKIDPFYSKENQAHLRMAIADLETGKDVIRKSIEDLEAMENE